VEEHCDAHSATHQDAQVVHSLPAEKHSGHSVGHNPGPDTPNRNIHSLDTQGASKQVTPLELGDIRHFVLPRCSAPALLRRDTAGTAGPDDSDSAVGHLSEVALPVAGSAASAARNSAEQDVERSGAERRS
jgi:hypothetical protein